MLLERKSESLAHGAWCETMRQAEKATECNPDVPRKGVHLQRVEEDTHRYRQHRGAQHKKKINARKSVHITGGYAIALPSFIEV